MALTSYPRHKVVVVGGGIIGALESYYAHLDAVKTGTKIRVVVYEKDPSFAQSTVCHIFPSLTPDEILSVVPRGPELVEKLAILFSQPGGIRIDDVPGVNDSPAALRFKEAVDLYGKDENHDDRTKHLLLLGKMSMDLWQNLYEDADDELKAIFEESNYNPCRNPKNPDPKILHDGYRIDLIYDVPEAHNYAETMRATYEPLGYNQCKILSPDEVIAIDSFLADFCKEHGVIDATGKLHWKNDCSALWRPGGCISTQVFLPKFYAYLKKIMGTYTDASGEVQDCFSLEYNKEVKAVELDSSSSIRGLKFGDDSVELDPHTYEDIRYVFCPGESIGTLSGLGFDEPAYAGFAGPSLVLNISLSPEQANRFKNFSHCMEVHKVGICLAWQARFKEGRLIIGVAGTKAFYGDQQPTIDQVFAKNRNLLHLNMVNEVLPEIISLACGYSTKGMQFTPEDLSQLENKGLLKRWVGRRAVAYDGFPTLGALYCQGRKVANGRCTTHLGSGGVSFAPAAVQMSRSFEQTQDAFSNKILFYADSKRYPII